MTQLEFNMKQGTVILQQVGDQVFYPIQGGGFEAAPCMWFALCENEAVTTRHGGPTGDVPICKRCDEKMSAL